MPRYFALLGLFFLFACSNDRLVNGRVEGKFRDYASQRPVFVDSVYIRIYKGSNGLFGVGSTPFVTLKEQTLSGNSYALDYEASEVDRVTLEISQIKNGYAQSLYRGNLIPGTTQIRDAILPNGNDTLFVHLIDTNRFPNAGYIEMNRLSGSDRRLFWQDAQLSQAGDTLIQAIPLTQGVRTSVELAVRNTENTFYTDYREIVMPLNASQNLYFHF